MDARGLAAWVSSTCKGVVLFGMRVCAVKVRIPGGRIIATESKVELNHGTGQNEFISSRIWMGESCSRKGLTWIVKPKLIIRFTFHKTGSKIIEKLKNFVQKFSCITFFEIKEIERDK